MPFWMVRRKYGTNLISHFGVALQFHRRNYLGELVNFFDVYLGYPIYEEKKELA